MMKEKKEFPKEEFSNFKCVLECSETQCDVFSPCFGFLFIVVRVDLGLMPKISLIHIFDIFWIFFAFNFSFSYLQAINKKNINF